MKKKGFYFQDYSEPELIDINNNLKKIKVSLSRVTLLSFAFFSLIFIFSIKIIYLSLSKEKIFYTNSSKNILVKKIRRDIIDRNGSILATNVILYDVGVRPKLLKEKEKKNLIIKLSLLFPELNTKNIEDKFKNNDFFLVR